MLQRVDKAKILGVIIDEKLSFKYHIESLIPKLSKFNYLMHHLAKSIPKSILMKLYYALAHPHVTYCITVWGNTSQYLINPLIIQHKKITRGLSNAQYLDHTSPLYKNAKLLKIPDLFSLQICSQMHKIFYNQAHPLIAQSIEQNQPPNPRQFRNNKFNLYKAKYNLEICRRSIAYNGVDKWNKLNFHMKDISLFFGFRLGVKQSFLQNY